MPGGDLECDHDEVVDDECGEGDGDDVEEIGVEEEQR